MPDEDLSRLRIDKTKAPVQGRKRRRFVLPFVIVLLLAAGFALFRAGFLTPSVEVQVSTVQAVYPSQSFTLLNASGYVVAQRKAALAAKITGRLVELFVEEGSRVKQDQVVALLENDDTRAARDRAVANVQAARLTLKQNEVELEDAQRALNRRKKVVGEGYVSQLEYDEADARMRKAEAGVAAQRATLQSSEAALKEAEVNVDYASIRAPFDAVVLTKSADVGDIVTPLGAAANAKAAVVTIADMTSLQVEADVSESNIHMVKLGQACEVQLDALPDERFEGTVHMIVPTADRSKASVMVKVAFRSIDPRILPEMSAKVSFLSREVADDEKRPILAVPSSVIARAENGARSAFLVDGERARQVTVITGREMAGLTQILEGLKAGDRVILNPQKVKDGARVKVAQE